MSPEFYPQYLGSWEQSWSFERTNFWSPEPWLLRWWLLETCRGNPENIELPSVFFWSPSLKCSSPRHVAVTVASWSLELENSLNRSYLEMDSWSSMDMGQNSRCRNQFIIFDVVETIVDQAWCLFKTNVSPLIFIAPSTEERSTRSGAAAKQWLEILLIGYSSGLYN